MVDEAYYTKPHKEQFREVVGHVVEWEEAYDDKPYIIGYAWSKKYFNYYFDYFGANLRVDYLGNNDANHIEDILKSINSRRVWIISGHKHPDEKLLAAMNNEYSEATKAELIRSDLAHLQRTRG